MRKNNLNNKTIIFFIIFLCIVVFGFLMLILFSKIDINKLKFKEKTSGIMVLIESTNKPTGLINMVSEMKKRNIYGLLMVSPEFAQANCEEIKKALDYKNIEIVPSNINGPLWDVPYEQQKQRILEMINGIEKCTGIKPRIISSTYMASDLNTIKVAEELKIPYIMARGTTGDKATVYQPEGYNVKILSVSNIPLVTFEYGSLCDYSFYERAGKPEDMERELKRALEPLTQKEKEWFGKYPRITPVSHTHLGGNLKQWNDMWLNFWNISKINWVTLDKFMENSDWIIPLWQIPINKNNPYTADKVKPLIPYDQETKVNNICE